MHWIRLLISAVVVLVDNDATHVICINFKDGILIVSNKIQINVTYSLAFTLPVKIDKFVFHEQIS